MCEYQTSIYIGRGAVPSRTDPVASDPFMMFIAPVERFDTSSSFATANFCEIRDYVQVGILKGLRSFGRQTIWATDVWATFGRQDIYLVSIFSSLKQMTTKVTVSIGRVFATDVHWQCIVIKAQACLKSHTSKQQGSSARLDVQCELNETELRS